MDINNDELIHKLLDNYKKRIENDRIKYHTIKKLNPEFMESNRKRAKEHYEKNKEKKKQKYEDNKEIHKSKNLYGYYKRNNKLDSFKDFILINNILIINQIFLITFSFHLIFDSLCLMMNYLFYLF